MNGVIKINNKDCQFSFDGETLDVYANGGELQDLFFENLFGGAVIFPAERKPLPSDRLEGYSYDLKKNIIFYIFTEGYGFNNSLDAYNCILHINVRYYFVTTKHNSEQRKVQVQFISKNYHKFLNAIPFYLEGDKESIAKIKCSKEISNNKAIFKYLDKNATAYPNYHYSYGINKFDFNPYLTFDIDGDLSEKEIIDFVFINLRILAFLFMRNNILPDDIIFYSNNEENHLTIVKRGYIEEAEKAEKIEKLGFVTWNSIYKYYANLFVDFEEKLVYENHIGNKTRDRNLIGQQTIPIECAFFEYTYTFIYGDKKEHSPSTKKINDELSSLLETAKGNANSKKRRTIDFLINQLDHVTLSAKMQKAIKDYKDCLTDIRKFLHLDKLSNIDIADRCSNVRNDIDHGNPTTKLDDVTAASIIFIRCVTYAMYLKRWGLYETDISKELLNLYKV